MRTRITASLVAVSVAFAGCASTGLKSGPRPGQYPQEMKKTITKTVAIKYLLYLPKDYGTKDERWPMILFLHGAGERGSNLEAVKKHGPPKLVAQDKDLPFVIVSPQCPAEDWWTNVEQLDALNALVDEMVANYRVDPGRIYLTGLSMGGYGTWALAFTYPNRFAAIAPICGGGQPFMARRIRHLPVWVFHGGKDPVVPIKQSEDMVAALKKAGDTEVKFTVYPEAGHDSWTETYDNPQLYKWFLEHRRKAGAQTR